MSSPQSPDRFNEEQATYTVKGSDVPDLDAGVAAIRNVLKTLPSKPGVYRMTDARGDVLYVGKARTLKNRVANYVQVARLPKRLQRMVAQTRGMTIVTTNNEAEALLLEGQLIKRYRPAYNVLLRDDKSFPFILLRADHAFPRIQKHRGARRAKGNYYGPFASAGSVNTTLNALQKLFLLRSCSDGFFSRRDRPCLLYQIKRCSAPCVGRISQDDYAELVGDAKDFLGGKKTQVQAKLGSAMQDAAGAMDFERAAMLRDRLRALTFIQGSQAINADGVGDADIWALACKRGVTCVQAFFIRGGQNWGHRAFFPQHTADVPEDEALASVMLQFYDEVPPPRTILTDRVVAEAELLAEALCERAGGKVTIAQPQRGDRVRLVAQAKRNAEEALDRRAAESTTQAKLLTEIAELFDLDGPPQRIEVYDNSHIMGTNSVGAMIVSGPEGFQKGQYRKFNIKRPETIAGDDFGMMREVLERRFARLLSSSSSPSGEGLGVGAVHENEAPEALTPPTPIPPLQGRGFSNLDVPPEDEERSEPWPALLLIDGGKGQVSAVKGVLEAMGVEDVPIVGVAKGPDRNAGREVFHLPDGREITLPMNHPVLFHLQRLRDEAHRFAIGAHRAKRAKALVTSSLDDVPGIGPARKKALLMHFGTARAVKNASLRDLQTAPGVSEAVAQQVYDYFHATVSTE